MLAKMIFIFLVKLYYPGHSRRPFLNDHERSTTIVIDHDRSFIEKILKFSWFFESFHKFLKEFKFFQNLSIFFIVFQFLINFEKISKKLVE